MQSQFLDWKDDKADVPRKIPDDHRVMYFERDRAAFGFMSHFHPAPLELDGQTWATAEHFYQAQKSFVHAYRVAIMQAPTPGKAKRLAADPNAPGARAKHSWFRRHDERPRPDWMSVKVQIMRRVDFAKFTQHSELAASLLETKDANLIEDSPYDAFWGIGHDGLGENWAGRVLMEIREVLRGGPDRIAAHALQLAVATTAPAQQASSLTGYACS
jgi:ribA/ribD-fused uncharacterized protein